MDQTHTQTNKKAVSLYNKCNPCNAAFPQFQLDRLIKELKDFTCCEEVGLRIFSILSISFNVLILDGYRKSSRKTVLKNLSLSLIVQYKILYYHKYGFVLYAFFSKQLRRT